MIDRIFWILGSALLFLPTMPGFAFTPMEYFNSFVAGVDKGFRDGAFNQARFNRPSSLAFDTTGDRLFVADSNNNRIRVVYLNEQNRVETIAGSGVQGQDDGPLSKASFYWPYALVYVPGDRLIVSDIGSHLLRDIDLKTEKVTTLTATPQIYNMVYREQDDSLYYSEPSNGSIQKFDLKTKTVSTVLSSSPEVPQPKALCIDRNKIYVADSELTNVYELQINDKAAPSTISTNLYLVGTGNHILEMTYSDGILYALQRGSVPLVRITPNYQPVTLGTAWTDTIENDNAQAAPLFFLSESTMQGFAASPVENRKLYIATEGKNSIISVKDYDFGSYWLAEQGSDFNYAAAKPKKTFRILVVGDSRLVRSPNVVSKESWTPSYRTNTFPKQLEFLLNMEASLQNVDTHFEVLMLGHVNECAVFFGNYEVPDVVKKYDVDLVLVMGSMYFSDYFEKAWTSEGIPSHDLIDAYRVKPLASRVPPGAPTKFYEDCKKAGLVAPGFPMTDFRHYLKMDDPEIRADLMEMMALPLHLLSNKLGAIRSKEGKSPQLAVLYIPWDGHPGPEENYDLFWKDVCKKNKVEYISVGPLFNILQTSFYPVNQNDGVYHYTAYGHQLVGYLLSRYLVERKLIPFEPEKPSSK